MSDLRKATQDLLHEFDSGIFDDDLIRAVNALRARLAAPEPPIDDDEEFTREDVTTLLLEVMDWTYVQATRERPMTDAEKKVINDIRAHLAAPEPEPEPVRHPGYVIGNHWLETAYERVCAGEAEDAILEDYELVREPRLRELRRDAERYWWLLNWLVKTGLLSRERCRIDSPESYGDWWILRKPAVIDGSALLGYGKTEDAAIDAAMEGDKT